MPVLDLAAYKPVPATLGDANQIANGFQAIVACINALDNNNFAAGLIFDPAKLMQAAAIDGDPLAWDNTLVKWKPASLMAAGRPRAPRVVVSTMAGGPPGSPVDQDIWVATAVDANGTRWAFQYNAGSGSASKWEFIGGGGAYVAVETDETLATLNAYNDIATVGPSFTMPRAGDYEIVFGTETFNDTAANAVHSVAVKRGAAATVDADSSIAVPATANVSTLVVGRPLKVSPAASDVYKLQYKTTAATAHYRKRVIVVTPVRVT